MQRARAEEVFRLLRGSGSLLGGVSVVFMVDKVALGEILIQHSTVNSSRLVSVYIHVSPEGQWSF